MSTIETKLAQIGNRSETTTGTESTSLFLNRLSPRRNW